MFFCYTELTNEVKLQKSVIVVDIASYHNVRINRHPTNSAIRAEMLFCLDKHGIGYSSDMTKAVMYDLIKMHKSQYEIFAINYLLADHGHTVIKLPPYHRDSNSKEKNWGIAKTRITAKKYFLSCEMFSNWQGRIFPL
jgi:hypothetical protein